MKFGIRIAIIALGPLAAVVVILLARHVQSALPTSVAGPLGIAYRWLGIISIMYIVNYLIAWRFIASWPIFMARSLVWGLIAYLCMSNLIDLFGENSALAWQILGAPGAEDSGVLKGLRGELAVWVVGLAMSAVCIGIGFEKEGVPDL